MIMMLRVAVRPRVRESTHACDFSRASVPSNWCQRSCEQRNEPQESNHSNLSISLTKTMRLCLFLRLCISVPFLGGGPKGVISYRMQRLFVCLSLRPSVSLKTRPPGPGPLVKASWPRLPGPVFLAQGSWPRAPGPGFLNQIHDYHGLVSLA